MRASKGAGQSAFFAAACRCGRSASALTLGSCLIHGPAARVTTVAGTSVALLVEAGQTAHGVRGRSGRRRRDASTADARRTRRSALSGWRSRRGAQWRTAMAPSKSFSPQSPVTCWLTRRTFAVYSARMRRSACLISYCGLLQRLGQISPEVVGAVAVAIRQAQRDERAMMYEESTSGSILGAACITSRAGRGRPWWRARRYVGLGRPHLQCPSGVGPGSRS